MTNRSHRAIRRPRRGVSLVELIVAMTVLAIGLLSIVSTSSAIARGIGEARLDNLAAMAAESRFEKLSGTKCASLPTLGSTTEETNRGIKERYVVTDGLNNTRLIVDSVSWTARKDRTRTKVFTTLIPCRTATGG